ncbi:MAG: hypothetical protein FWD75_07805 [Propionibacteriaceae bacterium]|nr:hypothetical protein [Propionibacteriaceae bacterium]
MSEEHGFVMRATVSPEHLAAYFDAPAASPLAWDDWRSLDDFFWGLDWDADEAVDRMMRSIELWNGDKTYRQVLAEAIAKVSAGTVYVPGGTFDCSVPGQVTIARAMYGENLTFTVAALTMFRGLESFLGPGESAWVVRSDVWWGDPEERPVEAVMVIEPGRSTFLSGDDPLYADLARQAQEAFSWAEGARHDDSTPDGDASDFWPDDSQAILDWRP